jgi:hypothetical protein
MNFPSSGLAPFVQSILNMTSAQATADFFVQPTTGTLGTPQTGVGPYPLTYGSSSQVPASAANPVSNSYLVCNATQPPSGSLAVELYGASQGNDTNSAASIDAVIPAAMLGLQAQIVAQTLYTYRM